MSTITRGIKRMKAYGLSLTGSHINSEDLVIEIAAERLAHSANRAISQAQRGELLGTYKQFELVSFGILGWRGLGGQLTERQRYKINRAIEPVAKLCKQNGVGARFEVNDGLVGQGVPGSITARYFPKYCPQCG